MKKILFSFLLLLFTISFSQTKEKTEELKDSNGHLIAKIEPRGNGIKEIVDPNGHLLGKFDSKRNTTYDKNGNFFGKGNLLTSLIDYPKKKK